MDNRGIATDIGIGVRLVWIFKVENGSDTSRKQRRERLEMWFEDDRCGSKAIPRLPIRVSAVKVREDELITG